MQDEMKAMPPIPLINLTRRQLVFGVPLCACAAASASSPGPSLAADGQESPIDLNSSCVECAGTGITPCKREPKVGLCFGPRHSRIDESVQTHLNASQLASLSNEVEMRYNVDGGPPASQLLQLHSTDTLHTTPCTRSFWVCFLQGSCGIWGDVPSP